MMYTGYEQRQKNKRAWYVFPLSCESIVVHVLRFNVLMFTYSLHNRSRLSRVIAVLNKRKES